MSKDRYGLKVTLPDSMSDEDKIKAIDNLNGIIKIFAKVAGEEPPDLTPALEAKKKLQAKLATKHQEGDIK